ncbi:MAG: type II toxin-antitoxin system HicB family antitoxin [Anaerolineaceae bacterium]|nr:type II toxin-antitoxin system HicB family antitoxin [Anaerolineaceae bacterium]
MNNEDVLWKKAGVLAAQSWKTEIEEEELSDGTPVLLASNPELPGCIAYGRNYQAAISELSEARQEYIYARLCHGFPVPKPRGVVSPRKLKTQTLFVTWVLDTNVIVSFKPQPEVLSDFEDVVSRAIEQSFDQIRQHQIVIDTSHKIPVVENFVFDSHVEGFKQRVSLDLQQPIRQQDHNFAMRIQPA